MKDYSNVEEGTNIPEKTTCECKQSDTTYSYSDNCTCRQTGRVI